MKMSIGSAAPNRAIALYSRVFFQTALFVFAFLVALPLHAAKISGTVLDPKGAVIVGARVEITGGELTQPLVLSSDAFGKFSSPDLKPGDYVIRITQEGFQLRQETVHLTQAADLQLTLAIEVKPTSINVPSSPLAFANSDAFYRQLRDVGLGESFNFNDFTLECDAATFKFEKGTLTFLKPVDGIVTGAIFVGEGHLTLKPVTVLDAHELERRIGAPQADEDFSEVVFRFTGDIHQRFLPGLRGSTATPPDVAGAFDRVLDKLRHRREIPLGFTEQLLTGEDIDNVDADVLASIYNHAHPAFFNAYIRGKKHKDLRFFLRARVGAMPQLDSPEEVALINYDPEGMGDGIWYLAHLKGEYTNHTASSSQDRRLFATKRYRIETVIGKNRHLFSTATITFQSLVAGERVLKFALLPNLRVSRVLDEQGQNLHFVQEGRKEDGSFYAILPKAPELNTDTSITVEYSGDKVIESAGDGSYYVRARTSWYPNLNGFGEHALFDLTFKVPKKFKVISVGHLEKESIEQDLALFHWVTPIPVAVAGFNYGDYQKVELKDDKLEYKVSGYYLAQLPDNLRAYSILTTMAPRAMTDYALQQTRAQLQICNYYYGKIPYDSISITEQPDFFFGQSWPNLVYLPIFAYTDSTQRWMLFGRISSSFNGFVQEVTPHEVAHQWWGHAVGWASYHDQWLSEGFAEFSAGLFLQQGVAGDWRGDYLAFWDRLRKRILDKNEYGVAPNDAGPIWMGLRLIAPKSEEGYQNVVYPKGAYVLQMLRSMMRSDSDKEFIAMMHDFVESHRDFPASTESFKAVAERHMTKAMDLQGNGRLDWFFNEWVYGTQVPRYKFDYQVTPENGKFKLTMTVTQSEVNDNFAMLVPVYGDFGKGMIRIGQFPIIGNSTRTINAILPIAPKKVAMNAYRDILER
ncbi:MAG TPA: M1 family aminopeptidase [Terriglobales bacterium]